MGNRFPGLFMVSFYAPRPGRIEAAQSSAGAIEDAEIDVGEADDPVAVLGFGDADGLADEAFADEDELAAPFDFAAAAHPADGMVGVVPGLVEALRTAPGRRPVMLGRRLLAERFVRPLVVVVSAEGIEARPLLARRGRRRPRGLSLQRPVHPFVPAVLLRCPRLDVLEPDTSLTQ